MSHNPHHKQKKANSNERYTPKWVFQRLGATFHIDVASPETGPLHTPCMRWFSPSNDGLKQQWEGFVWMNPPYDKPAPWSKKFVEHGNGLALLPTSQGRWWLELWYHPITRFVPMPSIKFETEQGPMKTSAPWRSWLVGMGELAAEALDRWEMC